MSLYERSCGYRYDRDRTVKEDAALIRADIRTLAKAGMLPADWKYSVRFERASMCKSIDVTATSPRPIYVNDPADTARGLTLWSSALTEEAAAVHNALDDLHNAYNHDGSDLSSDYFDVKFYGHAVLCVAEGIEKWPGGPVAGKWG